MNIFEKVTAVAAFLTFAALAVLVFALLLNARVAWRHRRAESAMRRARVNLLRDYWASARELLSDGAGRNKRAALISFLARLRGRQNRMLTVKDDLVRPGDRVQEAHWPKGDMNNGVPVLGVYRIDARGSTADLVRNLRRVLPGRPFDPRGAKEH